METVTILRGLWRQRIAVAGVFLLAVLVSITFAYRISFPPKLESRSYTVGVATSRILVDTPSSQVVEVAPKGSDSLGTRAGLIASLMVDGTVKSSIARRAGLQPQQFDAVSTSAAETTPADSTPKPRSNVLKTTVVTSTTGDALPIIEIEAQAVDAESAARLAQAAVSGLQDYLNSKAALQRIPEAKRLQVTGLGSPQARDVVRGPRKIFAFALAIFVFLLGCAVIIGLSRLAGAWRAAEREEEGLSLAPAPTIRPLRDGTLRDAPLRDEEADDELAAAAPTRRQRSSRSNSPWR
jgi:hypothetical protein